MGTGIGTSYIALFGILPWFHEAVQTPPDRVRFTLGASGGAGAGVGTGGGAGGRAGAGAVTRAGSGTGTDRSEGVHALLLEPGAGPVTLDEPVSAAVRGLAQGPGARAEESLPGAERTGGRITLTPKAEEQVVSVVGLPLR